MGSTGRSAAALVLLAASAFVACWNERPEVRVFTRAGEAGAFAVRVADDAEARRAALAAPLERGAGRLLRFATEERHELPANATGAPVDVLYASPLQTIVEVQAEVPPGAPPPPSRAPWLTALVLAGGFVERSGVMIGDKIDPRRVPRRADS